MIKNKKFKRSISLITLVSSVFCQVLVSFADVPKVNVDESLYLNLDYYGGIEEANVVKGLFFNNIESYTDYGNYKEVINMSTGEEPVYGEGSVTWKAPKDNKNKFFFEGKMDKSKVKIPWTFDITYKHNGVVSDAESLAGVPGLVEIDIDVYPDDTVDKYMQDNMLLMVTIPVDMDKCYSVDAPESQLQNMGDKTAVVFTALPGKEGHYEVRIGSDKFDFKGVYFMMAPATSGDFNDIKDLKEIKDTFRKDTADMADDLEALMDNVVDVKHQLDLTNSALDNIQAGKDKIHMAKDSIFDGNDVAIEDLKNISGDLGELDESIKTIQWLCYDLNKDLNMTNQDNLALSSSLKSLSSKLRNLGSSMSGFDNKELIDELNEVNGKLDKLKKGMKTLAQSEITEVNKKDRERAKEIGENYTDSVIDGIGTGIVSAGLGLQYASASDAEKNVIKGNLAINYGKDATSKYISDSWNNLDIEEKEKYYTPWDSLTEVEQVEEVRKISDDGKTLEEREIEAQTKYTNKQQKIGYKKFSGEMLQKIMASPETLTPYLVGEAAEDIIEKPEIAGENAGKIKALKAEQEKLKSEINTLNNHSIDSGCDALNEHFAPLNAALDEVISDMEESSAAPDLIEALDAFSSKIYEVTDDAGAVAFHSSRSIDKMRNLSGDIDTLVGTLNAYYDDVQKGLSNTDALISDLSKASIDISGTLKTVNDTVRSASDNFGAAIDDTVSAGKEAVDNTGKIVDNTKDLKDSGKHLRNTIKDELDEKEAENNFLNIDPEAEKISLTSSKNREPQSIQIVCRTDEISLDDENHDIIDPEAGKEVQISPFRRIINVFVKIFCAIRDAFKD